MNLQLSLGYNAMQYFINTNIHNQIIIKKENKYIEYGWRTYIIMVHAFSNGLKYKSHSYQYCRDITILNTLSGFQEHFCKIGFE
jgi:hypothetical protein